MTRRFDEFYLSALKALYDTERQQGAELPRLAETLRSVHPGAARVARQIAAQADEQAIRLEAIFAALYQKPAAEPCWIAAAHLREAADNARIDDPELMVSSVAVALLSLKRYEITRYEALMRWSMRHGMDEALPLLGRGLAEEIVMADALSALAFDPPRPLSARDDILDLKSLLPSPR